MKGSESNAAPESTVAGDAPEGAGLSDTSREVGEAGTAFPSHEDIKVVAYLKYLDDGCKDGDHLKHWLEAERQLKEE